MKTSLLHRLPSLLPLLLLCAAMPPTSTAVNLPARPLAVDPGPWSLNATQQVFTSRAAFEDYFGQRALAVDFDSEWVVLYCAGVRPTSGYVASIDEILNTEDGRSLKISTSLVSPGHSCEVERRRNTPYALAAFPAPRMLRLGLGVIRFAHEESIAVCQAD